MNEARTSSRDGQFQAPGQWIRTSKRASLYERDGWACVYCGRGPRDLRDYRAAQVVLTLDHLLPRSKGGDNSARNLVPACRAGNCSRQDRDWRDFAPGGAPARIQWLLEQPLNLEIGKAIVASLAGDPIEATR